MDEDVPRAVDDQEVPPGLAESIQIAFGLDDPPATLGDWVRATSELIEDSDLSVGVEDLCTVEESRHVARIDGDRQHFQCVLDTLLVAFLVPDASPVEVHSRSPVSENGVELTVTREVVEVTPPDAVLSFGFANDVRVPDPADVEPALAYQWVCPYINAFPSRGEYDQWASETTEASTMALPVPAGLELAKTLAQRPKKSD